MTVLAGRHVPSVRYARCSVTRGEAHAQPDADAEALELLLGTPGEPGLLVAQLGEERVTGVDELDTDAGTPEVGDRCRHLDTGDAASGDEHRVPAQPAPCGGLTDALGRARRCRRARAG